MADFYTELKTLLKADGALGALTSIILDDEDVGHDGLQRKDLLASASAVSISPAIFIKGSTRVAWSELLFNAERIYLEIFFYEETGYTTCLAMRDRVLTLLHRQQVTFDTGFCLEMYWLSDVTNSFDEALGNVSMWRSRYEARITRD